MFCVVVLTLEEGRGEGGWGGGVMAVGGGVMKLSVRLDGGWGGGGYWRRDGPGGGGGVLAPSLGTHCEMDPKSGGGESRDRGEVTAPYP